MAIESNEQQPEIFDSLPYYDNDLDLNPALKQKVEAELARENRQNPQTLHPKVPPPIDLFTVRFIYLFCPFCPLIYAIYTYIIMFRTIRFSVPSYNA